MYFVGQYITN